MTFEVAGDDYNRFMGRYSRPLAAELTTWAQVSPPQRALDVGCGPGVWTSILAERLGAQNVCAIDPSPPFVEACRRLLPGVDVRQGTAADLPYDAGTFDLAGASLVVHFMPDPVAGLAEMARVVRPDGRVVATVWDLAGDRAPMAAVWAALTELHPDWPGEHGLPGGTAGQLAGYFTDAGISDVEETEITVRVPHETFEGWWEPYTHGVGPIGQALAAQDDADLERVRAACFQRLGAGPFEITAVAYAVRGRVTAP